MAQEGFIASPTALETAILTETGLSATATGKAAKENLPFVCIKKKNYSQYDLVKIKVHLHDHFYVFSRFLMSRVLTLIKVNDKDAIKITLDIKKHFVMN